MKTSTAIASIALSCATFVASAAYAAQLAPQDARFAAAAARAGAAEIADAKQALQTTRNQRVDAFANRMITDHSAINAKLAAIMQRQHIPAPAGIGTENQMLFNRLEAQSGRAFDATYLAGEKMAHQQTIAALKQEIRAGKDPQLVAFAKSTLPIVQSHLAMLTSGKF